MTSYPSNLNDIEWKILVELLPKSGPTLRGRPSKHSKREVVDGIPYIIRTGGS